MLKHALITAAFLGCAAPDLLAATANDDNNARHEATDKQVRDCLHRNSLAFLQGSFSSMVRQDNRMFGGAEITGSVPGLHPKIMASVLSQREARFGTGTLEQACREDHTIKLTINPGPVKAAKQPVHEYSPRAPRQESELTP